MGFNAPSKIQETALPALLAEPPINMIAQSQSGTGKTAAFVLTMLSRVDVTKSYPQCLCLAPTYELALQIGQVIKKMAYYMDNLTIGYAVRGKRMGRSVVQDHVIIGTPGTVLHWIQRHNLCSMDKIRVFVLDEADVLISIQGYKDQSTRIKRHLSGDCQMLLFSATYDDQVMDFAFRLIPDPVTIRLRREEESLDNIQQFYVRCHSLQDKYSAICNIYGSISVGQSVIFCKKRRTAAWLVEQMVKDSHAVALLTGELSIEERADVINRFREGKEKVLITTNVSARGIDVVTVTVVVNFDLPVSMDMTADCETYLHRIGRAGRFGKRGLAVNLVDSQQSMDVLWAIQEHFGRTIENLDTDDLDAVQKIDN
ncbi:ATP-dependent RNA helicase DDX19A-like [Babylonia areolata]|uniref:ATP-dependent RNA helicase DDX19A-like n=1 Tax=Babylonia areolata TaxID=304850 RepID=UPI003FD611CE